MSVLITLFLVYIIVVIGMTIVGNIAKTLLHHWMKRHHLKFRSPHLIKKQ